MIAAQKILTDEMVAKIEALAPRYPNRRALTLPALHIVNAELLHVPLEAVAEIAQVLGLAPAEVQDTMTFYEFFHQEKPHGKVRAFVCRSISCALRGGDHLLEHLLEAARQLDELGLVVVLAVLRVGAQKGDAHEAAAELGEREPIVRLRHLH